jgi:DNA-binding MltR family transcriptional regulator
MEFNNNVLEAFQNFHDLALSVADECDDLISKQREMLSFVDTVKSLVADVRQLVTKGEVQDDGFQVHVASDVYLRITSSLVCIESALELTYSVGTVASESVPVESQPVQYTPSLSKR